jgi:hypothetical protein
MKRETNADEPKRVEDLDPCWDEQQRSNRDFLKLVLTRGLASVVGVDFALDLFRKALLYVVRIVVDLC